MLWSNSDAIYVARRLYKLLTKFKFLKKKFFYRKLQVPWWRPPCCDQSWKCKTWKSPTSRSGHLSGIKRIKCVFSWKRATWFIRPTAKQSPASINFVNRVANALDFDRRIWSESTKFEYSMKRRNWNSRRLNELNFYQPTSIRGPLRRQHGEKPEIDELKHVSILWLECACNKLHLCHW